MTHALNLSLHCARDSVMGKNAIFLETLLMLQDDVEKADEMWNEVKLTWNKINDIIPNS